VAELTALGTFWVLAALAIIPPVAFMLWLRAHENHGREPRRAVFLVFLYGGTAGVGIAIMWHVLFHFGFSNGASPVPLSAAFLAAVVIAPIVEEFSKALGLGLGRHKMDELEDGIIYGAAVGLGFAATENLVYGLIALATNGFAASIAEIAVRVFSSMLLHGATSALIGFGYGMVARRGGVAFELLPHYVLAVILHASYNFLVGLHSVWGFVAALVLVGLLTGTLRARIRELDALPHDQNAIR
jgi:RsiW-degrading membrane proteinase PrsW (M82 family)